MAAADAGSVHSEEAFVEADLSKDEVVNKYRQAADIVNAAIQAVLKRCVPGADVLETCTLGDKLITLQCAKTLKKAKAQKGIAFPTCISINNVVCHNSPMDPADSATLAAGDIVKVDMGAHIDGFIAVTAHTGVVTEDGALNDFAVDPAAAAIEAAGGDVVAAAAEATTALEAAVAAVAAEEPKEDAEPAAAAAASSAESGAVATKADVATAAYVCAELALRLVKPGGTNTAVTEAWARVAKHFGVNLCQGVLSHELKQFVIDGSNVIIAREAKEDEQVVEEVTFGPHQVFAIDVACSSGEGKPRETEARTTIFKRDVERTYGLKMSASRQLLRQVQEKSPTLPFSLRSFDDAKTARVGIVECVKHDLVSPFPVLAEREGDHTAHFKFTAMMLASGTLKATGLGLAASLRSDKLDTLPADLKAMLAVPSFVNKNKKKKKRSRKAKTTEGEAE
ncbi:hypothetical protein FNF27_07236 [Cafeteria roenbergensis]|uniref:Peptidase M24 domain-containing protein n=3 Tax=Cafeteria roenbergensis TaxID=33653 RepID=A0A5A8DS26_CAFRO|nr:hypothetical protein FNF27_07236 [Cafeteria roenbergensis]